GPKMLLPRNTHNNNRTPTGTPIRYSTRYPIRPLSPFRISVIGSSSVTSWLEVMSGLHPDVERDACHQGNGPDALSSSPLPWLNPATLTGGVGAAGLAQKPPRGSESLSASESIPAAAFGRFRIDAGLSLALGPDTDSDRDPDQSSGQQ